MEILIVYSEYSKKCKKFMSLLDSDPIIDINKFNKLSIDNPTIRNFIKDEKNANIKKVPSVVVKTNDDLQLYEGSEAFDWLESFSQQLYDQIADAEYQAEQADIKKKAEIDEKARLIALAKIKEYEEEQENQRSNIKAQAPQHSSNVKQQAKIIAQDRSNLSFNDQINTNDKPDTGTHVSQIKTSGEMSISDQVKQMEKEREIEEKEIQKARQMGMA